MRRVLIALAMIAATVFMAAPAIAQEDSTGSNNEPPASTEAPTTPPSEDPPSEDPPSQEDVQESPSAPETTEGPKAISVSVNSIFNPNNGHDTHDGGVFPADPHGDIIPPSEAESGFYPGQNWNAEGQAIFFNNCQPGDEPPPPGENKVPICHARNFGEGGDPYNRPNPSVEGILNGHAGHTGPVFFEDIEEQWGDIIPPFDFGPGAQFDGLNWDADGQAIYFNNCNVTNGGDDDDDGDDGDGDDDGDDDGDGDGALPDTGGQSLWILLTGGLLMVLGIAIVRSGGSIGRIGLFEPVLSAAPAAPWSIGRDADLPVTVVKPESHLGR